MLTGEIDRARGNYTRAIKRYQLALDTLKWYEEDVGPQPERAGILILSADAWLQQNRLDEAEKNYRAILLTWRQGEYLGHKHRVAISRAHNKLGEFAMVRNQFAVGESSFLNALGLLKDYSGPGIEDERALTLMNIALAYLSRGNGAQAIQYAQPAVNIFRTQWEKVPKGNSTYYARSLYVLGLSQMNSGDMKNGCETLTPIRAIEPGGTWDKLSAKYRDMCAQ